MKNWGKIDRWTALVVLALGVALVAATIFESGVDSVVVNRDRYLASNTSILISGLLLLPAAGTLYLSFRASNQGLALMGLLGFSAAGLIFLTAATSGLAVHELSKSIASPEDFATFGVSAQAMALMRQFALIAGLTAIAFGLAGFGLLMLRKPLGHMWLGWQAIGTAILTPFMWISPTESPLWTVGYPAFASLLLWFLFVGVWMGRRAHKAIV